jgi:hypothetical protein
MQAAEALAKFDICTDAAVSRFRCMAFTWYQFSREEEKVRARHELQEFQTDCQCVF